MKHFKGLYTALVTPFTPDDELNEEGLRYLIRRQIQALVDGIVILGTTGEAPTLSEKEKKRVMQISAEECYQKTTLIIGTGSYSTKQTILNTLSAQDAGADAALIVTPYYNKPTQEGFFLHFKTIAEAVDIPILIYNIPGRSGQNLLTSTLTRLLEIPSIVGVKEASGSMAQIDEVIAIAKKMRPEFCILSGDDALTLPLMALGGDGVISVISNVLPEKMKNLLCAIDTNNYDLARQIHYELMPLVKMAFLETNPIPIKAILELCQLPAGKCRLPLCELSEESFLKLQTYFDVNLMAPT